MPIDYPNEAALGSSASQGLPAFAGPQYDKIVEMIDAINAAGGGGTLFQVLTAGNKTGQIYIDSDDGLSHLGILDGGVLEYTSDAGGYGQTWIYGDDSEIYLAYNNNQVLINNNKVEISGGTSQLNLSTGDVWMYNATSGFFATEALLAGTKYVQIKTALTEIKHDTEISLNSPVINFPVIAGLALGNAVLYTDASGDLVPVTPTVNGYALTLVTGVPTWAAVPGQNAFGAIGSIDTSINDTIQAKQLATSNVVNMNSTGGGSTSFLLADAAEGFSKRIVLTTLGATVTVTPANFRNYNGAAKTIITFANVGDSADLVFNDGKWTVIAVSPSTIVS